MVENPVLFITFVRPEYARRSWDAIKAAQPKTLYFYSNKGRAEKEGEIEKNNEIRAYINEIDWPCNLHTWFRDECADIYTSLWGAIEWLFTNEEQGIVIEEDCVATKAFFQFCDDLLPRYADKKTVRMITGDNYTPQYNPKGMDYFFSHITNIYGWASWADRWKSMDRKMSNWNIVKNKPLRRYFPDFMCRTWYFLNLNYVCKNIDQFNPWDYITLYNSILNDQCCVIPKENLVWDIGVIGNHHKSKNPTQIKEVIVPEIISVSTSHFPSEICSNFEYDKKNFYSHIFRNAIRYFPKRIFEKYLLNRK